VTTNIERFQEVLNNSAIIPELRGIVGFLEPTIRQLPERFYLFIWGLGSNCVFLRVHRDHEIIQINFWADRVEVWFPRIKLSCELSFYYADPHAFPERFLKAVKAKIDYLDKTEG
jgi:hypothetical protein